MTRLGKEFSMGGQPAASYLGNGGGQGATVRRGRLVAPRKPGKRRVAPGVSTVRADPLAWPVALQLAGHDRSLLQVLADGTVRVLNRPRT